MSSAKKTAYKRQPPPLALRYLFGIVLYGVARPVARTLESFGRLESIFRSMTARRLRSQKSSNPFRGHVPTEHDVFVATFAKSGTNWMMQIAHQLIYHGHSEYEHLHDLVPWPDTKAMPFVKKYAIPIEEASAKVRTGPPLDDEEDYGMDVWAGVLPLSSVILLIPSSGERMQP